MNRLKDIFDFQKFAGNERLAALISDTESRYSSVLSLEDLEFVNAAGNPDAVGKKQEDK